MSVTVTAGATFSFGRASFLFDAADMAAILRNYDVAPDGERFVVVKQQRARGTPQVVVVENWFEDLKARVPTK